MNPNYLIRETEVALAAMLGEVKEEPAFSRYSHCSFSHEPRSHVIMFKENELAEMPIFPCAHSHYVVDPWQNHSDFLRKNNWSLHHQNFALWFEISHEPRLFQYDDRLYGLEKIITDEHWQNYIELRIQTEKHFGADAKETQQMVSLMKQRKCPQGGGWFLLSCNQQIVGAFGIFLFDLSGQRIGRLQEVDVFPQFQGKGHGSVLLAMAENLARSFSVSALTLCCDTGEWPALYYRKFGFQTVGQWDVWEVGT
jgi:GNAT superfamily N-acetyltransferase